jgi:hypothetical protein
MMTPFRHQAMLTAAQRRYNKKISAIRQNVERAIGLIKNRFRRLLEFNCQNVQNSCLLIMTACTLHNLCILSGEEIEEYLEVTQPDDEVPNYGPIYPNHYAGTLRRNQIVQQLDAIYGN